jgi:hypothetical protein
MENYEFIFYYKQRRAKSIRKEAIAISKPTGLLANDVLHL